MTQLLCSSAEHGAPPIELAYAVYTPMVAMVHTVLREAQLVVSMLRAEQLVCERRSS
jgi:hypothetical protein